MTLSAHSKLSLDMQKKSNQIVLYLEIFNFKTFRAEILQVFELLICKMDDFINSFWHNLTFSDEKSAEFRHVRLSEKWPGSHAKNLQHLHEVIKCNSGTGCLVWSAMPSRQKAVVILAWLDTAYVSRSLLKIQNLFSKKTF